MARAMPWFRLYTEARTDPKLKTLTSDEFRLWFNLLCYAAEQDDRGQLDTDDAFLLALQVADGDEEFLRQTLRKLVRLRMIDWPDEGASAVFINFAERQYDKPSDSPERTRERKARQRENWRDKSDVTPMSRDVTPSHAQIREEKNREETEKEESSGSRKRSRKPPQEHGIDEGFRPCDAEIERQRERGWDDGKIEREIDQFRDWHKAKGTTYSDWDAAFRMWCKKGRVQEGDRVMVGVYGRYPQKPDGGEE